MPAPAGALVAAEDLAQLIADVRGSCIWIVEALVATLSPTALESSYFAGEPGAVASLYAAHTRAAQHAVTTAAAGVGAWTRQQVVTSVVPDIPDGLVAGPTDLATILRQTVLGETHHRLATGMDPADALQSARLRGGRATANIGADTARNSYTATIADAGMGWARIPTSGACDFCLLMASRGAVYQSQQTAQGKTGSYHPWDRCRTVAVPRGSTPRDYLTGDIATLVAQADADYRSGILTVKGRRKNTTQRTPQAPPDPRRARELADRLELSAVRMDAAGMPDAAAEARRRAAALRAQADSGSGGTIPTPRAGGSGGGSAGIPTPRTGGSGGRAGGGSGGVRSRGPDGWSGPGRIPDGWPTSEKPADGGLPGKPIGTHIPRPQKPALAPPLDVVEKWQTESYWTDPPEVDIADWLLAHGYTISRVRRIPGSSSPDSVIILGDGRQTVEWKTLTGVKSIKDIAQELSGRQATRYIVRLAPGWSREDLGRIVDRAVYESSGILEEIVLISDDVYRWKGET